MKVAVVNLGCKVNRVESDVILQSLIARGCECVSSREAEYIVVNTCTVTGEADKKTRKAVRRALRCPHVRLVVVTGCAVAIHPDFYAAMDSRIKVEPCKLIVPDVICQAEAPIKPAAYFESFEEESNLRIGNNYPTRVGIKVQDGCNNACTFCIVHVARGRATSRDIEDVVAEAKVYEQAGVEEIILTGINLGSYRCEGFDLTGLLKRLLEETDTVRYRVGSVEPRDIDDDFIDLLAHERGRICRHLHLPLQAGSSKVLREMARPYSAQFFEDLLNRLYSAVPSLSLSTDVICGFPGETEEEFEETLQMVEKGHFSKVHVFPYSIREGTPAARREDQINPQVKADRVARLSKQANNQRFEEYLKRCGTTEQVLVETGGRATTESYFEISVPESFEVGRLYNLHLEKEYFLA